MRRSWWSVALLAALVAALAAWVYLKPPPAGPVEHPLSALQPSAVTAVLIERPGEPAIAAEKKGDAWSVTRPFPARGDETRIRQVLEIAQAKSAHRYRATDLARFELAEPQARLTLSGQTFSFGLVSPVTREQYVQAGEWVYVLSPRYGAALPASAADLASPRLLGPDEAPARFDLGAFSVTQRDGGWRLAPGSAELSQDDFVRWVDNWRHAAAARVELHPGYKPAVDDVRITLKDGREIVVGVLSRAPEVTLVRPDEKLKYFFRGAVAQRLLAPPGATTSKPPNADERR
jgi:hypothetical protein